MADHNFAIRAIRNSSILLKPCQVGSRKSCCMPPAASAPDHPREEEEKNYRHPQVSPLKPPFAISAILNILLLPATQPVFQQAEQVVGKPSGCHLRVSSDTLPCFPIITDNEFFEISCSIESAPRSIAKVKGAARRELNAGAA